MTLFPLLHGGPLYTPHLADCSTSLHTLTSVSQNMLEALGVPLEWGSSLLLGHRLSCPALHSCVPPERRPHPQNTVLPYPLSVLASPLELDLIPQGSVCSLALTL